MTRGRAVWGAATVLASVAFLATAASAYPQWIQVYNLAASTRALEAGNATSALVLARRSGRGIASRFTEGRALLELGRWEAAQAAFGEVVARADDPEILRRALHNLALANLRDAATRDAGRRRLKARASVAAGREALRLDSRIRGTRWNLALAQRLLRDEGWESPGSGGDEGAISLASGAVGAAGTEPMSPEEATRLLDAFRSGDVESLSASLTHALEATTGGRTNRGPPW